MKTNILTLWIMIAALSSCTSYNQIRKKANIQPQEFAEQNSSIVYLSGDPKSIGQQYGKHFKTDTKYLIDHWLKPRMSMIPNGGRAVAINKINKMKRFVSEDFRIEIEQAAIQLDIDADDLYLANAAADIGQHIHEGNFLGCSSYIVEPSKSQTGKMLFGRNLDYSDSLELASRWVPVVFAKDGVLKILSIHAPGMTGVLSGINEKGVLLMIHVSDGETSSNGIPSSIGYRHVLERATSTSHAVELIKSLPWTFAMNIIVADGKKSAVVEVDAKSKEARYSDSDGLLFATNHFRTEKLKEDSSAKEGVRWKELEQSTSHSGNMSFDDLKNIVAKVGGFSGNDPASNVLAVFVDYATNTLYFSSDPSGKVKAANGSRRFKINLSEAFKR